MKGPGYYPGGNGLYLQLTESGARSWIYSFSLRGRSQEMGFGSLATMSLADARSAAEDCRKLRDGGRASRAAAPLKEDQKGLT